MLTYDHAKRLKTLRGIISHEFVCAQWQKNSTNYWALPTDPADPVAARRHALASTYADWLTLVLTELDLMHPGLAGQVTAADLWVWGHGMVAPTPGYVWGAARQRAAQPWLSGRVHLAHTDYSGVSVFEEAFHQGRRAAQAALAAVPVA